VTKEFEAVYSADGKLIETHEVVEARVKEKKVLDGADEVRSWEWQYGQTPEFTNEIEGDLSIGKIVSLSRRSGPPLNGAVRILDISSCSYDLRINPPQFTRFRSGRRC